MKNYEGMFLIDTKEAKKGSDAIEETIKGLIEKCKGQLVRFERWDERRLAYEIDGVINGTYYLYYFSGEADTISTLNREIQLSSKVLRALFLRIKKVPEYVPPRTREDADEEGQGSVAEKAEPAGEEAPKAEPSAVDANPSSDSDKNESPPAEPAAEPAVEPAAEPAVEPAVEPAADDTPAEGDTAAPADDEDSDKVEN